MAMAFTGRLYTAPVPAKLHSRRMDKSAMRQQVGKRHKPLEVHIVFEPSRLAQDCLRSAYAQLIPPLPRRIAATSSSTPQASPSASPCEERS
jgi:hypothetical protein